MSAHANTTAVHAHKRAHMHTHIDLLQLESYDVSLLLPTVSPRKVISLDEDSKYIQYCELEIMNLLCRHVLSPSCEFSLFHNVAFIASLFPFEKLLFFTIYSLFPNCTTNKIWRAYMQTVQMMNLNSSLVKITNQKGKLWDTCKEKSLICHTIGLCLPANMSVSLVCLNEYH